MWLAKMEGKALQFFVEAECNVTKARACKIKFARHGLVSTPVFMPVGTQGTLKALTPDQLDTLGCEIMLANTYHLGHRPGPDLVSKAGGLHEFAQWKHGYLTDSGGFQMVSLLELSSVTEEGVKFKSPHDGSDMLLSPEHSIHIQNQLGSDIAMQLDDVVHSSTRGPRVVEAMHRSIRWLDRCIKAHGRRSDQALFGILQGGLDSDLRKQCAAEMIKRDVSGFAIGGLSGGEEKELFWPTVDLCTDLLPKSLPRYLMGVGYAEDLVVCVALGCDMFDCVFPTRTARFGVALNYHSASVTFTQDTLNKKHYAKQHHSLVIPPEDFNDTTLPPIGKQGTCNCIACTNGVTRSAIYSLLAARHPAACQLLTSHNIASQLRLMRDMRQAIIEKRFPNFVKAFFRSTRPAGPAPPWAKAALASVSIILT